MIRSVVVLLQPDGPTRTRNSLSRIPIERSSTGVTPPKRFVARTRTTAAMARRPMLFLFLFLFLFVFVSV